MNVIGDAKNVAYLRLTAQLKDFLLYAQQEGLQLYIAVREGTVLSKALQALVDSGAIEIIRCQTKLKEA